MRLLMIFLLLISLTLLTNSAEYTDYVGCSEDATFQVTNSHSSTSYTSRFESGIEEFHTPIHYL
ncbi:hypothetical protein K8I28_03935, partial [bacterium]|nr:hypothetical protein [bacterium]